MDSGMNNDDRSGKVAMRKITDGTSKTIMVVEADDDHAVIWTKPDDLRWQTDRPTTGLGSIWPSQFYALFADGSCQPILLSVGADTLRGLFTRNGREVFQLDRF